MKKEIRFFVLCSTFRNFANELQYKLCSKTNLLMKKLLLTTLLTLTTTVLMAQSLPYQNPNLTAEQRADDLLGRLTLEEKVKLMMDSSPAIPRLGIPQFQWWNEALHGVGRNGFATVFPITMAMAASWNDALLYQVFTAVSDEARVKAQQAKRSGDIKRYQSLSFWTPNINIFRDPRWGRGQETYGEDPYLTTKMGLAVVNGLQGQSFSSESRDSRESRKYKKLLACAKHFAVHSGPEWNRHTFNIEDLPERDLWETYLPAFKALVQEGKVAEVMCAYQRIDGQACCAQNRYEQQILRDEWGFEGLICSDCGAIRDFLPQWHNVAKDGIQASAKAVLAGTDVECGSIYKNLPAAVKRGDITEAQINTSLKRLLVARFELGDFDKDELVEWTKIPEDVVASKAHKQLALDMARQSIVLLKNNGVLPLSKDDKVVVLGQNANDAVMQWGNYAGSPTETVTILDGIRQQVGDVRFVQGCGLTRNESYESRFNEMIDPLGNPGMQAIFWNNMQMKGQPVTTVNLRQPIHLNNGGNTVFAPGVELENFSARLDGTFKPTRDETLLFDISADDMLRLIVNGDTIVDIWKVRHRTQGGKKELKVKAGEHYRIQIDYGQEDGYAALNFDIKHRFSPTSQELLANIGQAETVVFVGGIAPTLEGEEMKVSEPGFKGGDRTSIELPQSQRDVLAMLHQAGKKVVFVNCSGSAIAMTPELESCDAIVQAWYPGEQGGTAVADVLFGKVNPSGKLPITFYKSTNDLPDFLDYTMKNRTYRYFKGDALFPFGYGLSYTTFDIGKPVYKNNKVRVTVKNTGHVDGTEVVQVYIRNTADKEGPLKTLRAYQRVALKAGEQKTVDIDFPRERFEGWDMKTNTIRVVPGKYELMVGNSSADKDLKQILVNIK
jgi:beta-glucosidase